MGNPLYNKFGNSQAPQGPFDNTNNLLDQFNQFSSAFQGDPQQKVQELLNSGQMSQEQFNRLSVMAQAFSQLFHR